MSKPDPGLSSQSRFNSARFNSDSADASRDALAIVPAILVFGIVFGAASVTNGFSIMATLLSSASIFAGASQFVLIEIIDEAAWLIALTIFAVNFRHILYSAAIGRKLAHFSFFQKTFAFFMLTDLQFTVGEMRYENIGHVSLVYYFMLVVWFYPTWLIGTFIGAYFGSLIDDPALFGFDYVLPLYFLAILLGFRARANFAIVVGFSALVSLGVYKVMGSPWHISLGGLSGIFLAAMLGGGSGMVAKAIGDDNSEDRK